MNQSSTNIGFSDVSLQRGDVRLFKTLSLILTEKRIGLIGNNGSGKSSFLRLINGLLLPDEGEITVCGLDTRRNRKSLPCVAAFLFQNPDHQILFPTVGEEISFGPREAGIDANEAKITAEKFLAEWQWEGWANRPVQELSDGQKQRLCILAVLIMHPKILLLDEPFASLDLPTKLEISEELMRVPQTIIMASHDLDLIASFDRVLWFDSGRIVQDGKAREVVDSYKRSVFRIKHQETAA